MKQHWVMDYETLSNCFVAVFIDVKSDDQETFVIHKLKNDIDNFIYFLERNILYNEWHVSFNGLGFDGHITEYILRDKEQLQQLEGEDIAKWIYGKAQYIIGKQNAKEFLDFSPRDLQVKQLDVFKLNHWDNAAKRSSLKWIQYTMDWSNIKDMPIHHSTEITTQEEIDQIIKYCINDVESTKKIMNLSKSQIQLRQKLTDEYNINLYSASEPRISKELFLYFLSKKTGISKYELRQMRTYRNLIVIKDLILPYVKFKTATFQKLLSKFKEATVEPQNTKGGFKYSARYRGVKTDFGLGGIHGAREAGVYESDKDHIIMSSDVTSFYPNLAIRNGWAPKHLPKIEFCDQYEWFFEERKKIPKSDPKNYVYKIILNSTYGLSNDKNSFLYDPEFTMRITINGQLSLCMLYEMIMEGIPNATPIMHNTDGLETIIPREYQDKYMEICKEWEDATNLQLEHDTYQKVILGDVNNYIAVKEYSEVHKDIYNDIKYSNPHDLFKEENGKFYHASTKCKGRFEFSNLALHKNKSFLVIPKAIYNYFVHEIDPEKFITEHQNILDFCGGKKIRGDWTFYSHYTKDGKYVKDELQHTLRYYVSNKGCKIIKRNNLDDREIQLEAGKWMQTLFIRYKKKPFDKYDLNYNYYITKAKKEIKNLEPLITQYKLF